MKKWIRALGLVLVSAAVFTFLFSCGYRKIGYGVVLWSSDESLYETGTVVPVIERSSLENSYTLLDEEGEPVETAQWRITFFKREKDAEIFAGTFEGLQKVTGIATSDGLPIRSKPDSSAERTYRMRRGETVKVLERSESPKTEGQFEDYWYKVLTRTGVTGWVFGYNLSLGEIGKETAGNRGRGEDPLLINFLANTWRPEYYREMIEEGTIDLERFQELYGIFPYPDEKKLILNTRFGSNEFVYTDIISAGGRDYLFEGTPVRITLQSEKRVVAEYPVGQKFFNDVFVLLDADVTSIISRERERRLGLYEKLTEQGKILTSDGYGTLEFEGFTKFQWRDYWRLVPDVVPEGSGNAGKIEFALFLGEQLKTGYDGVLQLTFSKQRNSPLAFLYSLTGTGVRFVYVPAEAIENKTVVQEPKFPIILSFSYQEG